MKYHIDHSLPPPQFAAFIGLSGFNRSPFDNKTNFYAILLT